MRLYLHPRTHHVHMDTHMHTHIPAHLCKYVFTFANIHTHIYIYIYLYLDDDNSIAVAGSPPIFIYKRILSATVGSIIESDARSNTFIPSNCATYTYIHTHIFEYIYIYVYMHTSINNFLDT